MDHLLVEMVDVVTCLICVASSSVLPLMILHVYETLVAERPPSQGTVCCVCNTAELYI